jgi:hypothetical protein
VNGRSRRDLLKASLGLLGVSTGIGAGLSAPAPAAGAERRKFELRLAGIDARAHVHGAQTARLPRANDQLHIHGMIDNVSGSSPGTFTATGVVLRTPSNDTTTIVEQHLFVISDGTITGSGQRAGATGTFAVTGGSGRYTGAQGSYLAHIDPVGTGGTGTAQFDFSLSI